MSVIITMITSLSTAIR